MGAKLALAGANKSLMALCARYIRYIRYNNVSETQVMPYLDTPAHFYAADGTLEPECAAYVDRLRDLAEATTGMAVDAGHLQQDLKSTH